MKTTTQATSTLSYDARTAVTKVLACIPDEDRAKIVNSTPVARAFAIVLACELGPAGLGAVLKDVEACQSSLDEAVARIREAWRQQQPKTKKS